MSDSISIYLSRGRKMIREVVTVDLHDYTEPCGGAVSQRVVSDSFKFVGFTLEEIALLTAAWQKSKTGEDPEAWHNWVEANK